MNLDRPLTPLPPKPAQLGGLWSVDARMHALFDSVRRAGRTTLPVLVQGPTGSGKELIAKALHESSLRAHRPLVAVNCGALSPQLVESELFGHKKGAFTGADNDRPGLFEAAKGGTIFLDEVGELPLELQPRLLRALETGTVRRVGDVTERPVDARVVAATHRDLSRMVAEGKFREDLLHRLWVLSVSIPALSVRKGDIVFLAERFIMEAGGIAKHLSPSARTALLHHDFPGNVRELKNRILRAHHMAEGAMIEAEDLGLSASGPRPREPSRRGASFGREARPRLPSVVDVKELSIELLDRLPVEEERRALLRMIDAFGGNRARVARVLGIGKSTLHARLKRLGVPMKSESRAVPAILAV